MKGVIFGTEDVRAILDGRKTMFRDTVKPQYHKDECGFMVCTNKGTGQRWVEKYDEHEGSFDPPRYVWSHYLVGDILYARETWEQNYDSSYVYRADRPGDRGICKSPIFMPRAAARIFLRVTDVRVERLQDITEEDAIAEGTEPREPNHVVGARYRFGQHWNARYAKRHGGIYAWERNPWVFAYRFERISKEEAEREDAK